MSKGKLLAVCLVWLFILGVGAIIWRVAIAPARHEADKQQQKAEADRLKKKQEEGLKLGGTPSRYEHTVDFHLDSFSGYALIRSPTFNNEIGNKGIRIRLHDDNADYLARIKALKGGEADMAVFTIDALVKVCAEIGELPATIVAVVDETTGADAIVAYKETVPNVDALNYAEMRFALTSNSPSETLARVVMSRFNLDNLGAQPLLELDSVEAVVRQYEQAKPTDKTAYVLWEPFVSHLLKNPAMHVVVDSSRFPSTIVDVIVAGDDFIAKNRDVVKDFVEGYLRVVYDHRERSAMVHLVTEDAKLAGAPLTAEEANKLVDGIWWKNTQENLAHFGFLHDNRLPHIEDMISNITEILVSTGGIRQDPTDAHPSYLYFASVLDALKEFHPGVDSEQVREIKLPALSDAQWDRLTPVGTARVPPLVFARGTDRLTEHCRTVLDDLAQKLKTTRFYVVIRGNASRVGDLDQNKRLAQQRAEAAERYLVSQGIDPNRIRATGVEPSGSTSVSFVLGQLPY